MHILSTYCILLFDFLYLNLKKSHFQIKRIQVSDILLKAPLALAEELDNDIPAANGGV